MAVPHWSDRRRMCDDPSTGRMQAPKTPADSPLTMEQALASERYRDLSTPKLAEGDRAYAFELERVDAPGERVRLADFAGKRPVALVFGSYT
jgi:hypothetical protein